MGTKRVAVLIKDKERQYEGLRSSLGLLLENHEVSMFVLNYEVDASEEYLDKVQFIEELEGSRYSNVPENVEKYGFQPIQLQDIPEKLRKYDLIFPY